LECLVAAHKLNAEGEVLDSLQTSFPDLDWRRLADYYSARLIKHAKRQAHEMEDVSETLEELGVDPYTAMASAKRLGWLADFDLIDANPEPAEDLAKFLELLREAEEAAVPPDLPRAHDFSI